MESPSKVDAMLKHGFDGLKGTLEQRVQELADREEIKELVSRYAQCITRRLPIADMFTDDGAFILRLPGASVEETRGRAELIKLYAMNRPAINMPALHNHVISVSGDEAIGTSWIELYMTDDTKADKRTYAGSGYYADQLRRENARWKFAVRDATFLHWVYVPPS